MTSTIDRFRQPEYVGDNRCVPCTVVNIIIAAALSVLAAIGSVFLGIGVLAVSLMAIYLRGYLIPGTPTLTKRYLPERVLRWFDKTSRVPTADGSAEVDSEEVLLAAGAIEPWEEKTDLRLTDDFQEAWHKRIRTVRTHEAPENRLMDALNVSSEDGEFTLKQRDNAFVAFIDSDLIGQWSSQAAVTADVAASAELNDRLLNWYDYASADIARILMGLRIFIEQCPECDGPVQVEQDVVESCCWSYDVIVSACQRCDARLIEMEWNDILADDSPEQLL